MFRKIMIAFVLLLILVGFSYVKTTRDYAKQDAVYEKGKSEILSENKSETENYNNSIDSLGNLLTLNEESFNDSLTDQKDSYDVQLDSLENIIDNQSAKISDLSKRPVQETQTVAEKTTKPKQLTQHEKIYRYYKKRYSDLPSDLSPYEKKISLSEIREETASKFSITLKKLTKIRNEYNLNY